MDSMYPRILTETGTVGLVAFFILIGAVFRMGWSAYREVQDPFSRGVAMGFLLGFVGLLVHAIGANTFILVRVMEPFWLVAALVARVHMTVRANRAAEVQPAIPSVVAERGRGKSGTPAWSGPRLARLGKPR
jgi:O-antigen ligase